LHSSLRELTKRSVKILRCSGYYITEPWGGAAGGDFTNAVIEIERAGSARDAFRHLQEVEKLLGRRRRQQQYEPRACDLDLLLWGSETIRTPDLVVPHLLIAQRRFVLTPLCDLIPDGLHPELNKTFRELLESCSDPLRVQRDGPANLS
jgi:2-amino-4-hydroxy-6-hydroxymethyldihydropteridine diphosphokinase